MTSTVFVLHTCVPTTPRPRPRTFCTWDWTNSHYHPAYAFFFTPPPPATLTCVPHLCVCLQTLTEPNSSTMGHTPIIPFSVCILFPFPIPGGTYTFPTVPPFGTPLVLFCQILWLVLCPIAFTGSGYNPWVYMGLLPTCPQRRTRHFDLCHACLS